MHHRSVLMALFAAIIVSVLGRDTIVAQIRPLSRPASPPAATTKPKDADADVFKDPAEQRFPGGAALKTDPEQQRLLTRAQQCVDDGRLDLAAVLWQKVLDEAGDTLMAQKVVEPLGPTSTPLMIYGSLAQQVEQTLARLPPAALAAYRTSADADARALLAAASPGGEEEALAQVVRRYFLSSIGDDAAYKLACLALDRHDFVGASRLLNKIVDSHPDPSIAKADLLTRLAVAAAHMQDRQSAERSLEQLATAPGPRPPSEITELISLDVKSALSQTATTSAVAATDWHMPFGSAARTGSMPALPAAATSRTLSELWVREFPLTTAPSTTAQMMSGPVVFAAGGFGGMLRIGGPVAANSQAASISREELVAQWRAGGWRPTGRLLFDRGRVFLKTPDRLICYGAGALTDQPIWQSAWENQYQLDGASQQLAMMAAAMGANLPQPNLAKPKTPLEVLLFGDRVHQSLAIADGVVYSVEGKRMMSGEAKQAAARPVQFGTMPRRSRSNWLTAYQAGGGKALWTRSASDEDKTGTADVGFLAAPTPCGSLLLAPVTDGGTMWLFGLDRATGKTVWKAYLCDEPQGGASPWAEPVLAVDGREAYLTCGCGVVFAVDAVGGTIRWAVRYARDGKPNTTLRNMYGGNFSATLDLRGWDDDVVMPYGRMLIVMSSDSDRILALDRRTGERMWESPRNSPLGDVNYCVGVNGRNLYVAGENVVRRYDIPSGRLVQELATDDSYGRGCVTADAVYVPVKDSILKLDVELKQRLARVGVALTSDEPVGNLFSDGEKLWVVGAGRVYAMTTLEHRLEMLARQIAGGDPEAQLNRMRLYVKQNRSDLALDDLRGAYGLFLSRLSADEAALRLFAAMSELKLPQTKPLVVLSLLNELFVNGGSITGMGREAAARLNDIVASSVSGIRREKPAGAIAGILAASPLLAEEYLQTAAAFAVDAAATRDDVGKLIEAIVSGSAAAKLVSIRAATRLAPDDVKAPLMKCLSSTDDRFRLAAARSLANLGERKDVLETLIALLNSDNVLVRSRSQQALQALTGQQIPFAPEGSAADRAATAKKWQEWLAANGTAKLNLPLSDRSVVLGRTLVVASGLLVELDADHTERWRTRLAGDAWGCQGLPNGHRLVAMTSHAMVVEYDDAGKEVWKRDRLPSPPTSVQRLENGNTVITCGNVQQIIEVSPDGSTVATLSVPGHPISAQRLDNGNTLVALQQTQRVVEVNRSGTILWEARTGGNPPWHAVRLDNGNTLITLTQARKVVEYDPTGKTIVWSTQIPLSNPYAAQRLASGNTLVADQTGVHEIDASGKVERWKHPQQQVRGLSSF